MRSIRRRTLVLAGLAAAGGGTLAACTGGPQPTRAGFVDPDGVHTWTYGGALPGSPIRVKAGEVVRATLANELPEHTTIHWHGLALRNDADGVPDVTQPPVDAGGRHVYQFTAAHPGTYWLHPHAGVQLDRGLYAPLIVDDPHEPLAYDDEWIVVLDDWLDGVEGRTPVAELERLRAGMMGGHMMGGASSRLLGGDAGDVTYPHGHTFSAGPDGPRKDTAIVLPGQTLTVGFDADNPGVWMVHCHNIYHAEAGMMTLLGYERG